MSSFYSTSDGVARSKSRATHTLKIMWLMGATWLEIARTCRECHCQARQPGQPANFCQPFSIYTCPSASRPTLKFVYLIAAMGFTWAGEGGGRSKGFRVAPIVIKCNF